MKRGSSLVATPVCAPKAFNRVKGTFDAVDCVEMPPVFQAVGLRHANFTQTTDEEVLTLLERV
jgi:putative phosphoribosyl transferase